MEIFFIILASIALALMIALIKFVLRNMRKGFALRKDHIGIIAGYIISTVILGGHYITVWDYSLFLVL